MPNLKPTLILLLLTVSLIFGQNLIEGFESGQLEANWSTIPDRPWNVDNGDSRTGSYSVLSPAASEWENNELSFHFNCTEPQELSFYIMKSITVEAPVLSKTQAPSYTGYALLVSINGGDAVKFVPGNKWKKCSVPLQNGENTIRWQWTYDNGVSEQKAYSSQSSQVKVRIDDITVSDVNSPQFSMPEGFYSGTQIVALNSSTENAKIFYTLDGSIPDSTNAEYLSPLEINSNTQIKAVAYKGGRYSTVTEADYYFGTLLGDDFHGGILQKSLSPYYLSAQITIGSGDSLVIEPGTEVVFIGSSEIRIQNDGYIKAVGLIGELISFKTDKMLSDVNCINRFYFDNSLADNKFSYCKFADIQNVFGYNSTELFYIYASAVTVDHSVFKNISASSLLYFYSYSGGGESSKLSSKGFGKLNFSFNSLDSIQTGYIISTEYCNSLLVNNNDVTNCDVSSIFNFYSSTGAFNNNKVTKNKVSNSLIYFSGNDGYRVTNNLIADNISNANGGPKFRFKRYRGGMDDYSPSCCINLNSNNVIFVNNTVVNNGTGYQVELNSQPISFKNNIIRNILAPEISSVYYGSNDYYRFTENNNLTLNGRENLENYNNNISQKSIFNNNLDFEPGFIDQGNGNYHLLSSSGCINIGHNDTTGIGVSDLDGKARIYNSKNITSVDLGCYEFEGSAANAAVPEFSLRTGTYGLKQTVELVSQTESAEIRYTLNGSEPDQNSILYSSPLTVIDSVTVIKARAYKNGLQSSAINKAIYFIGGGDIAGTLTKAGSPYYFNKNLEVTAGQTLTIEPGVTLLFSDDARLVVKGTLQAVGAPGDTIVFTRKNNLSSWGGISFTGEQQDSSFLKYCKVEWSSGIGIDAGSYGQSAVVNCVLANNQCGISSIGRVEKCTIYNNYDRGINAGSGSQIIHNEIFNNGNFNTYGGGVYAYNNSLVENNIIKNNKAEEGGGVYASSSFIVNNLITGNDASYRGDGLLVHGGSVSNNTIINNSKSNSNQYEVYLYYSKSILTNNLIFNKDVDINIGNYYPVISNFYNNFLKKGRNSISGTDVIPVFEGTVEGNNPGFTDLLNENFTLLSTSACVNMGKQILDGLNLPVTDLAGNSRIYDGNPKRIDIGSYEYQGDSENKPVFYCGTAEVNFNNQAAGSTQSQKLLFMNNGNAPLIANFSGLTFGNHMFTVNQNAGAVFSLQPGQKDSITVTFAPKDSIDALYTDNLKFTVDDKITSIVLKGHGFCYPDLIVESIEVTPSNLYANEELTVKWQVKNIGKIKASKGGSYWYDYIFANDQYINSIGINAEIMPGQSANFEKKIVIPDNYFGNYDIKVIANNSNRVTESNYNNNTSQIKSIFVNNHPALFTPGTADFNNLSAGEQSSKQITLTNRSQSAITIEQMFLESGVNFSLSFPDDKKNGNRNKTRFTNLILNPSEQKVFTITFTPKDSVDASYTDKLVCKVTGEVDRTLNISGHGICYPDLIVESIEVTPSNLYANEELTVKWQVKNIGKIKAVKTNGYWDRWSDKIYANNTQIGSVEIQNEILPGRSEYFEKKILIPVDYFGAYNIKVVSNNETSYYNRIAETDYSNNTSQIKTISVNNHPVLFTPGAAAFDTLSAGKQRNKQVTISNRSQTAVTIEQMYLESGTNFSLSYPNGKITGSKNTNRYTNLVLNPNEQKEFTVTFTPKDSVDNDYNDKLICRVTGQVDRIFNISGHGICYPDLIVENIEVTPNSLNNDDELTVKWKVKNIGKTKAIPPSNTWNNWTDRIFANDDAFSEVNCAKEILPGQSENFEQKIIIPSNFYGKYNIKVMANNSKGLIETNYSNNASQIKQITVVDHNKPVIVSLDGCYASMNSAMNLVLKVAEHSSINYVKAKYSFDGEAEQTINFSLNKIDNYTYSATIPNKPGLHLGTIYFEIQDSQGNETISPKYKIGFFDGEVINGEFPEDLVEYTGQPYYVGSDITVPAYRTITIEAGNIIRFLGNYQIKVEGKLKAEGLSDKKILFTILEKDQSDWGWRGLYFNNSNNNVLENCIFEYSRKKNSSIESDKNGGVIYSNNSSFIARNCEFKNNSAWITGCVLQELNTILCSN